MPKESPAIVRHLHLNRNLIFVEPGECEMSCVFYSRPVDERGIRDVTAPVEQWNTLQIILLNGVTTVCATSWQSHGHDTFVAAIQSMEDIEDAEIYTKGYFARGSDVRLKPRT